MAKKYVCDICGQVLEDPYSAKMREFYLGVGYAGDLSVPEEIKTFKRRVDLCGNCFDFLKFVAHKRKNEELQKSKEESKE